MSPKWLQPPGTTVSAHLVPEERIELSRAQGPLDFESSASTCSTTPAGANELANGFPTVKQN